MPDINATPTGFQAARPENIFHQLIHCVHLVILLLIFLNYIACQLNSLDPVKFAQQKIGIKC